MPYSIFVIVCLVLYAIINADIFRRRPTVNLPALKSYRIFVVSIALYFLVDLLWGIFEENKLPVALYTITTIYFVVMGFTILAWANYVAIYLGGNKWFRRIMLYIGNAFFLAEIVLLIINIITPVLFTVDMETCVYTAFKARYIMLYVQSLFYFLLAVYSIVMAFRKTGTLRGRYIVISLYSLIMFASIAVQIYQPYLPIYSIGCIIGTTAISIFVVNGIKDEYKLQLEKSRNLVEQRQIELTETKQIAYTDPLTGVKNKHAYVEEEDRIDKLIAKDQMEDFAVVVFDLNGLKKVNDTKGHDAGDVYIVEACHTIEKYFGHDNLYRFGGDEFVAILTKEACDNRIKSINEFEKYMDECLNTDKPIISSGMSRYRKDKDNTYHAVFYRADKIMYSRKEVLKEHQGNQ